MGAYVKYGVQGYKPKFTHNNGERVQIIQLGDHHWGGHKLAFVRNERGTSLISIEGIKFGKTQGKIYENVLGYKVVVIPHLKQVRLLDRHSGKEHSRVELTDNETVFDPVYGFLMAYTKLQAVSNTKLQNDLDQLRHDPKPQEKLKS